MSDNEDDPPQLSYETFTALQEFYKEQSEKEHVLLDVCSDNVNFDEDWQLSQFWYDESTINELVNVTLKIIKENGKVALISCPTLYKPLRDKATQESEVHIYEYDKRFAAFGEDFAFYDYKSPLDVPRDRSGYYDLVIADPPFLSDECLTKTAVTIKFLSKNKIILCTGSIMADMAKRLLDLHKTSFHPKHKNNLANEFSCYANFDFEAIRTQKN